MQCRWGADGMNYINLHPFYDFCGQIGGRASRSTTLSKSAIHTLAAITCAAKIYEFRIMNCSCGVVERDARPPIGSCDLAQKKSYDIVVQYHNSVVFVRKSG